MKKYTHHYYNSDLKEFARELRTETVSRAEKRLWKSFLSRKQTGERFLRQRPILNFIVDFVCLDLMLVIEIDGSSHLAKSDYDAYRQRRLEKLGFQIMRFSEGDVMNNLGEVMQQIEHAIYSLRSIDVLLPPSSVLPQGRKQ